MKADRPHTTVVLIDLQYHLSQNAFEEFYGDHITYQEIEQESYIEFKELMFERIHKDIKFRKYGRIGPILTIKADMLKTEIERFKKMLEGESLKMTHNWMVSNITVITDGADSFKGKEVEVEAEEEAEDEEFEDFEDI